MVYKIYVYIRRVVHETQPSSGVSIAKDVVFIEIYFSRTYLSNLRSTLLPSNMKLGTFYLSIFAFQCSCNAGEVCEICCMMALADCMRPLALYTRTEVQDLPRWPILPSQGDKPRCFERSPGTI
jgi:hypothetical protein